MSEDAINESYEICFRINVEDEEGDLVVLEKDRAGNRKIVRIIHDLEDIFELYDQLIGREI